MKTGAKVLHIAQWKPETDPVIIKKIPKKH